MSERLTDWEQRRWDEARKKTLSHQAGELRKAWWTLIYATPMWRWANRLLHWLNEKLGAGREREHGQ